MAEAFYSAEDRCWYVPVAPEQIDSEELAKGIEPVRLQLKDRQLWITKLEDS